MPKKEKGQFQSWNPRSKRWILFEDGHIKKMSLLKFEGVRVEKGKPESSESAPSGESPPTDPGTNGQAQENPWSLI